MFENVLGQEQVVSDLTRLVSDRKVPTSMLFEGPEYSGKLTTALELARAMTCKAGTASWNCGCRSCMEQRALIHHDTRIIGHRNFMEEITATADVVQRVDSLASRYLFARAIRKMLRRLDTDLWDASDKRLRLAGDTIDTINEIMETIIPSNSEESPPIEEKEIKRIVELSGKAAEIIPRENIPVDQIRRLSHWANHTTGESAKIAILTDVDRMGDSSKNALLRLLEEPPQKTYFIMVTTLREALPPTIRSRLRPFRFNARSTNDARLVLERIFRETTGGYDSLVDYFLAWNVSPNLVRNESVRFLEAVVSGKHDQFFFDNPDIKQLTDDRRVFRVFLAEVIQAAYRATRNEMHRDSGNERIDSIVRLDKWNRSAREMIDRVQRLNIPPANALESLFYRMRETV